MYRRLGYEPVQVHDSSGKIIDSFGGSTQLTGNVTLNPSPNLIGLVTVANTINALATITPSGNVTVHQAGTWNVGVNSNVTLNPSPNAIGIVTVGNTVNTTFSGNVTLNPGSNFVGLVTTHHGSGNVTLNPSPNYIGLVTVANTVNGNVTLNASPNLIGIVTVGNTPAVSQSGTWNVGINSNITLNSSPNLIGIVTVGNTPPVSQSGTWSVGITSNVTLNSSPNYIGLVTTYHGGGNVTLNPSSSFIGLTTTVIGSSPTLYAVVNTEAASLTGNVTLNPGPNQIGSVTISHPISATFGGNVTLNPSPNYVGLVTTYHGGGNVTLNPSSAHIGSVSIYGDLSASLSGNITLNPGPNQIGSVTISHPISATFGGNVTLNPSPNYIGLVTTYHGGGNVTLNPSPNYIGLVTIGNQPIVRITDSDADSIQFDAYGDENTAPAMMPVWARVVGWNGSGNVRISTYSTATGAATGVFLLDREGHAADVNSDGTLDVLALISGNVTLNPSSAYVGLVTSTPVPLSSLYTSVATILSAAGANVTLSIPPSGQRFVIKDLHVSSLGRNEVRILSGATILIPYTSLSTTAGFFEHYGDSGLRGKAVNDALVIGISGAATVSAMVNLRFE